MRGKAILWLGSLLLIAFVAFSGFYGLGAVPLAAGLTLLTAYSTYLALAGANRPGLLRPKEVPVPRLPASDLPFVSLIVPAKDEERVIEATIRSLLQLDYYGPAGPHFEIIAVDDGWTDATYRILAGLAEGTDLLTVLHRPPGGGYGKSAVLNEALPLARGDLICVFDADARVEADFLLRAVPRLLAPGVGAVQAQKRIFNTKGLASLDRLTWHEAQRPAFYLPLLQDVEMLMDTACQIARGQAQGAVDLRGNGMLVKREALLSVGGWNEHTLTDDLDLTTRLQAAGWHVAFCAEAVVWEEGVISWGALFRQRRRWIEGCIRRYLDYSGDLLRAPMPLAFRVDALVFAAEFVLPLWLFFGLAVWAVCGVLGIPYDPAVSYAIALGNVAVMLPFVLVVVWRQVPSRPLSYLVVVLAVSAYLVNWLPVIVWTDLRLAALRPQREWSKTEHVGETV